MEFMLVLTSISTFSGPALPVEDEGLVGFESELSPCASRGGSMVFSALAFSADYILYCQRTVPDHDFSDANTHPYEIGFGKDSS